MSLQRIVCMVAELPELFDRLGALDRVVGISAYTTRPESALGLPKVSGFQTANVPQIRKLEPDLAILSFDVQKELGLKLAEEGIPVLHLHPHRLEDMFQTISIVGGLLGKQKEAARLTEELRGEIDEVSRSAAKLAYRPRVYFEEWMDPLISGTGWISDLIELAGGEDIFRDVAVSGRRAKHRIVKAEEIINRDPELIVASWCGKPFDRAAFEGRSGFGRIAAIQKGAVAEMDGAVLQCGPGLMDCLKELHIRIRQVAES